MKKIPTFLLIRLMVLVVPGFMLLSGCHKASPIPCYLHIEPFTVTTDYPSQGSNKSKITDVWVYVNNQNLGAYQLPCTIPVILNSPILANGKSQIILSAGILKNGLTTSHIQYPFYSSWFDTISLSEGGNYNLQPKSHYIDSLNFFLKEDFTNGNSFVKLLGDTLMKRDFDPINALEGNYGKITLDATHDTVEVITSSSWNLVTSNASSVFIEMNYKCDYPFTIGLLSTTASTSAKYWHETF